MEAPQNLPQARLDEYNFHYDEAARLLDAVIRVHEAPRGLFAFFKRRKTRRGIEHLLSCLEIVPQAWQCMWLIGKAHQALDDNEAALTWFEKALPLEKNSPDVPREACLAALATGGRSAALAHAEEACRRAPEDAGLVANLALAYLLNRDKARALAAANRALDMNRTDPINQTVRDYIKRVMSGEVPQPDKIGQDL